MADTTENKKVKVQLEQDGKDLYPKTLGKYVYNNNGDNLGDVEAGAQKNTITSIEINGKTFSIDSNGKASGTLTLSEYTFVKADTADDGYAATYYLTKDGVQQGAKLNIFKDQVLESVTPKTCETADEPTEGLAVGDLYWDFAFQNVDKHIYLRVQDFFDSPTEGNGINIINGVISVDTTDTTIVDTTPTQNSTKLVQSGGVYTELSKKQNIITSTNLLSADLIDDSSAANKFVTSDEKTSIANIANKANSTDVYLKTETYSKTEVDAKNYITYRELTED